MANLGTLEQMAGVANQLMPGIVKNGSDIDKLLALLGSAWGGKEAAGKNRRDSEALDTILAQAKANPNQQTIFNDGNSVSVGATPALNSQEYSYIMNGGQQNAPSSISIGQPISLQPSDILSVPAAQLPQKAAENAYNPNYNWDYINAQAKKAGVSQAMLDNRKADIQKDIAQTANRMLLPEIQKNLYGYTDANGNPVAPSVESRLKAMSQIDELAKYSPETAKAYTALAVNGLNNETSFAQKKELAQMQAENAAVKSQRDLANRIAYRNATAGLGKSNTSGYGNTNMKIGDVINLGKRVSELEAVLQERYPNGQMNPNDTDVQQWLAFRNQLGLGGQPAAQQPSAQQPAKKQAAAPAAQAKPEGIKEAFTNRLNKIDVSDWDSINNGGLELVKMLQNNGMSYDEAMTNVLKVLKPRISPEEYAAFKGDYKTDEDRTNEYLNWGGRGQTNTVGSVDDILNVIRNKVAEEREKNKK